jgi:hypothetical protein
MKKPPGGDPGDGASFITRRHPNPPDPNPQDDAELPRAVRGALTFALAAGFAIGAAVVWLGPVWTGRP